MARIASPHFKNRCIQVLRDTPPPCLNSFTRFANFTESLKPCFVTVAWIPEDWCDWVIQALFRYSDLNTRGLSKSSKISSLHEWLYSFRYTHWIIDALFWHSDFHARSVVIIDENGGLDNIKIVENK